MNRAERRAGSRATRVERRAAGAYDPIVTEPVLAPIPRYLRRHTRWQGNSTTRSARRERARVIKISRRLGVI